VLWALQGSNNILTYFVQHMKDLSLTNASLQNL